MDYMTLFKGCKTIYSLITSKDYISMVGETGINAAQNALLDFARINNKNEKNKLLESAINHFEFADAALQKSQNNFINNRYKIYKFEELQTLRVFIWCNIAKYEKYLGNVERMKLALTKAHEIIFQEPKLQKFTTEMNPNFLPLVILAVELNPITWVDQYNLNKSKSKYFIIPAIFEEELLTKDIC